MVWDAQLLFWLNQGLVHPFLDGLMIVLTFAAMPVVLVVAILPLLVRRWQEGIALLAGLILSTLLAVGIQFTLLRPRPVGVRLVLSTPAFFSFPSGHAAGAFACAVLLGVFWRRWRWPALLGAVLVSLSRVYLGHHYPSDVLGGAILGVATALVVYGCFYLPLGAGVRPAASGPAESGRPVWAWLLWGQLGLVLLAVLGAYLGLLDLAFLALPGADKLLHFLLFGVLAFLAVGWWWRWPAGQLLAVLGLLALAEEMVQAFSPVRSLDGLDLAATLAGVALFGWLGGWLRTRDVP